MCHFSEHLLNNDRFCRDLLDSIVSIDNFNKTLVTFEINIYLSLIFSSMRFRVGNFKPSSQGMVHFACMPRQVGPHLPSTC